MLKSSQTKWDLHSYSYYHPRVGYNTLISSPKGRVLMGMVLTKANPSPISLYDQRCGLYNTDVKTGLFQRDMLTTESLHVIKL